ncbi:MAG TPA: hypothetical protein ENJ52_13835 [Aliiroseovarius sp.]|nr:hypothetical protein [Aliiroseovarius sp.]
MRGIRIALAAVMVCISLGTANAQYIQTEFASVPKALAVAKARHMVLARDFFGRFRFVTPGLARRLVQNGFRYDSRGMLVGYSPMTFLRGLIFNGDAPMLRSDSYEVTIVQPERRQRRERDSEECTGADCDYCTGEECDYCYGEECDTTDPCDDPNADEGACVV